MPFGIIGRTGPGMSRVVGFGDRSTGKGIFGVSLGRAIVTNGNLRRTVYDSAATRPSSQITLGSLVKSSVSTGVNSLNSHRINNLKTFENIFTRIGAWVPTPRATHIRGTTCTAVSRRRTA